MPAPLLETKLYLPRVRGGSVPRPRLTDRLDRGAAGKLTLVSAPAGCGKTTLLAQWLEQRAATAAEETSVAWLSLDAGDNDPTSFWTYVISALRTTAPAVGANELDLLQAPDPPPVHRLLTTLLNDLGALPHDVVLALDDYHAIDAREVHEGVAFLLDHSPPRLHLVIAGRVDPPLPLAKLRAQGELTEIRVADLRFTPEEAEAYLNDAMGLTLSDTQVATLEGRTEGWIAALQLAALSLQGRDDVAGFIGEFAGDDRYIVDYLVEEVLQRQPDHVATFLLHTSVLSRLTGPLCDAVTGQGGGRGTLEALERGNLFVVPLDDHRRWYRYHHLFADVLQARLLDEQPAQVPLLHRRASDWYEENGQRTEAIHHAMAARDFERAAELVERTIPVARRDRRDAALRGWLEMLPDEMLRVRPVLSVAYAGALLSTGTVEGVEQRLRDAERWLGTSGYDDDPQPTEATMVVVDEDGYRRLPGWIALYRAATALALGDTSATVTHAQRASELLEPDDQPGHAAAAALLGLAAWTSGDLDAAHAAYAHCQAIFHEIGYLADVLGCATTLADIRVTQGRLHEAILTYQQALERASAPDAPALRGTVDMYVGMSDVHREQNDLVTAARFLHRSQELGEHLGMPRSRYRWHLAMARLREAEGDLEAAVTLLDEAERSYTSDFAPDVRPVPAVRARVWIAQGRLEEVFTWLSSRDLSPDNELTYLREFEHVTLARALLARYERDRSATTYAEATGLLARLLDDSQKGGRAGTVVEVLILQALAHQLQGDRTAALESLERALTLGAPAGYARIFLDEGPTMVGLLEAAADAGIAADYVRSLLAAPTDALPDAPGATSTAARSAATRASGVVVEPLSEREHDVLRLLRTELGGPEIARELVLSLNTIRTHTRNIYAKLGVNNRRAAVRRAEELELLPARPRRHE